MLSDYPGSAILDVGGGHGQLTGPLLDNGYKVTVFGSSEVCIERIRRYVDDKRCFFQVGNILDLPYPDRSFDVVISYRLLPHVERWNEYLAELARVANQVVMLDYPEVRSVNSLTPYLFSFKKNLEGNTRTYTVFRQDELIKAFNELGYQRAGRYPEFFFPMVLHRKFKAPKISSSVERISRLLGLTGWFGSPVILKMVRSGG
jgi:2-polyprenyl-3-methyl-5-hydroxy-6-metoxy-1,4-benzoquinol methylase